MKKSELLETDDFYKSHEEDWLFYQAAYDGYKALIDIGLLDDFKDPEKYKLPGRAYGFNYSRQIADLTTGFIARSDFSLDFDKLSDDDSFKSFLSDCDLFGTDFGTWWNEARIIAACFGLVGILTTQAAGGNPAQLKELGIYPYLAAYTPLNILKRGFDRDPITARPRLSYLKLRQTNPDTVVIWTTDNYETYAIPEKETGEAILIEELSGKNELGEIPFVFYLNMRRPGSKWDGMSLIKDVAPIDASMIRSAIFAGSIEQKSGFPILAVAQEEENMAPERVIDLDGESPIVEYDPENSNARPYWIAPEADRAINPILNLWKIKKAEIYGMSYLQGLQVSSESGSAHSGEALEQMFIFLTSRLSVMVDSEIEARKNVLRLWLKWHGTPELFDKISITHDKKFNVRALVTEIADILTEKTILKDSETALKEMNKQVVNVGTLKDISDEKRSEIFKEIDKAEVQEEQSVSELLDKQENTSDTEEKEKEE